MSDWSRGYVADSTYQIAFQTAQNPAHLALVCAVAGVDWQPRAQMRIADLGCGRGYAVNALAAANPDWTVLGLDHNPVHVDEAMQCAARAGLGNALFLEADLASLTEAELERIAPLDVVMLHGVWSWVSDAVRAGVVRFLRHCLKPGGIAYLGYNVTPGARADAGLQRLLRHLAGPVGLGPGQAEAAAAQAMARLREMAPHLPLRPTAMLARLLADPPRLAPGFVAHEFLTEHWRPVFQEDLCAALAPAKLQFVGSCNLFEAIPSVFCDAAELTALQTLPEGEPREFLKDLYLPRGFRADVFIRGARRVNPAQTLPALMLAACRQLPEESPVQRMGRAEVAMAQPAWQALRAALGEGAMPLGELRRCIGQAAPQPGEILAMLTGGDWAMPVLRAPARQAAATRFNLTAAALHGHEETSHLAFASPVAAGGLPASGWELRLAAALIGGADRDDPLGAARLLHPLANAAEQASLAQRIAASWAERIPIWEAFGVI
ncbi:class I SAM-dependent methyltransferase [Sediminicoccus sp. KRV36]|uniref:class I SAM-dependent methyltransferase n=1 Tax=Sediminicoccus sp. KRV36 TaxID=3133721 RepID=UPI00200EF763|nr:class I SAM-dependent methyltransferase [Sediminicoccus rosea]UPY37721.1 class I SAM-dependent methyltransferase [Sediminicoccus rosea]